MIRQPLSRNFYLHEFLRSDTAARMGRKVSEPEGQDMINLRILVANILQPLRDDVGRIEVTSGYRPLWLNTAIGGAPNSAHITGRAADIRHGEIGYEYLTPRELAQVIIDLELPFDKLILEFDAWVHVQIAKAGGEPRKRVLTAMSENRRTVYKTGLA